MIDWQWGSDFLSKGRKKYERPLYDRGLRIWKTNKWDIDSDIAIGWVNYAPLVIYHKDNSTTIQAPKVNAWNTLFGYSTRLTIVRYSGIKDLFQRDFKHYIVDQDACNTPPKIQGCRQCSQTGLQDVWCYPQACWNGNIDEKGKYSCTQHPGALSSHGRWHMVPCEHGQLQNGHTIKNGTQCYYCSGTKKRDYGSKLERTLWDGSPIRVRNGNIIKSAATLLERMVADYVRPIT
jgi:hypothetical protein